MSRKQLLLILPIIVFAATGTYSALITRAASNCNNIYCMPHVPNPPLAQTCGLDIALLIDGSGSMNGGKFNMAKNAMITFVKAMEGTNSTFAIGLLDLHSPPTSFSSDTTSVLKQASRIGDGGGSHLGDMRKLLAIDPRPDRSNLFIALSDFNITMDTSINEVKQSGTRVLALRAGADVGFIEPTSVKLVKHAFGPNLNTGSILTADGMTISLNSIGEELARYATEFCKNGNGNGGTGSGNGNGGTGTGAGGTGQGTHGQGTGPGPGAGAGGGGSIASTQANEPTPLPSSSAQGETKENPKVEPSPFFDGKEYKPGSDPLDKAFGNLSVGGNKIIHGWAYLLGVFFLVGNMVAGYFLWWKRLSAEERAVWRARLPLG